MIDENQSIRFRQEDLNKAELVKLQSLLRQRNIRLFKICYVFTNRFTVMQYFASRSQNDSCILFLLAGQPSIGFIQNIIRVRHDELILRICKVTIKDQLHITLHNRKLLCPNIFYGDIEIDNNGIFIKPEAIIEKIVYVYNTQLKRYVFFRVPNLCEST